MEEKEKPDSFLGPAEELHPDLKPWMMTEGKIPMLKHPLVYSILHTPELNNWTNRFYQQKLKQIEEAKTKGDWEHFIWLHERPWRMPAFKKVVEHMSDKQYWDSLHGIWIDSENIWQHKADWIRFLSSRRPGSFMDEEDRAEFEKLPEEFSIYRGYQKGRNFDGLSYTLEEDRAKWFSKRFEREGSSRAAVRERLVKKSEVFAFTDGRSEKEIIMLPQRKVGQ